MKKLHYGYMIIAAVFIDLLVCGGIFFGASGIFIVPVSTALGIGQGDFSMYLTIQSFTMAIGVMVAPKILAKFSYRMINAVATVVSGLGFVLMGFAQNVVFLYVGGVLVGTGCVFLTYLIAGVLLPRWFKKNQGTAMAVAMSGLGIGGIIFNPVISFFVNAEPMLGFSEAWRSAYVILGLLVIAVCLPVALFIIRDFPADKGILPYGEGEVVEATGTKIVEGVSKSVAAKSMSFVWYAIMVVAFTLPGAIMTYLPAFATSVAPESGISAIIASVGNLGAIVGGFIIGWANDKFGAQIGSLVAGGIGTLGFVIMMLGGGSAFMLLAGSALYGIFYQLNSVQMPAMVGAMYGEREYDKIFPLGASISPWVGMVSYSLWGFLFDATQSYTIMLLAGLACSVITGVTGILAMSASKKLPRETAEIKQ